MVCGEGIHYFLTRRVAELYNVSKVENGLYQQWHNNGRKYQEATYADRKCHGLFQIWYSNGQKLVNATYVDGKLNGLYQRWQDNGQKYEEAAYVDGKPHGLYRRWYTNGQKAEELTRANGELHGLLQSWYPNGQKAAVGAYINGKPYGLYQSWHFNGRKQADRETQECDADHRLTKQGVNRVLEVQNPQCDICRLGQARDVLSSWLLYGDSRTCGGVRARAWGFLTMPEILIFV